MELPRLQSVPPSNVVAHHNLLAGGGPVADSIIQGSRHGRGLNAQEIRAQVAELVSDPLVVERNPEAWTNRIVLAERRPRYWKYACPVMTASGFSPDAHLVIETERTDEGRSTWVGAVLPGPVPAIA